MIVTEYLDLSKPMELTEKEIAEIDEAARRPITFDEECPPMTEKDFQNAMEYIRERRNAI